MVCDCPTSPPTSREAPRNQQRHRPARRSHPDRLAAPPHSCTAHAAWPGVGYRQVYASAPCAARPPASLKASRATVCTVGDQSPTPGRWARCDSGRRSQRSPGRAYGAAHVCQLCSSAAPLHRDGHRRNRPAARTVTLNVVTRRASHPAAPVMVFIPRWGYILELGSPRYTTAQRWRAAAACTCRSTTGWARWGVLTIVLSTPQITSNVYLRDLVLALRWARQHREFGGISNVTIFGESAGAHITATLLAVPAAKAYSPGRSRKAQRRAWCVRARWPPSSRHAANLIGARRITANALIPSPAQLVETQHHLIRQGMRKKAGRL